MKRVLGVGQEDSVDPYGVLSAIPARLIPWEDVEGNAGGSALDLVSRFRYDWSAIGFGQSPASGEELILVNPTHHPHRQRVSLMEEIVHIVLGHPKTALLLDGKSAWQRPYNEEAEDEAYCVGAACILPYARLFPAVYRQGLSAAAIAEAVGVSEDYATYRISRAGLARVYAKQQRTRRQVHRVSR